MLEQDRKVVSLQSYRELESCCRLWMSACEARDQRIQELERDCQTLRQRVAKLSRRTERQTGLAGMRKQVRFAR